MDRLETAVEYRQRLRNELHDALNELRPTDYTLTELRDLLAILGPARERIRGPVCRQ